MSHPGASVAEALLTAFMGAVGGVRQRHFKRFVIWIYTRFYPVNLDEAVGETADDFETFNHFFTRRLKPGARPLSDAVDALVCPADGTVSQAGPIVDGQLLQAKGQRYSVAELLGDASLAARYEGGTFVTIYLSPRDYHRVHVPCASELASATEIPGRLFSVNASSERRVAGLFGRNERLAMHLTAAFGDYALVMVGALIVAGIDTPWQRPPVPREERAKPRVLHPDRVRFARGDEVGTFRIGSTVICLFPPDIALTERFVPDATVRMGEAMAVGR
ncbi:MAG: archaetidylserine decarboxylase [Gammaproteobacteria bacterium]|nr:archaetidylserine decarboxylase [Gammaproteobacteria bacterium]